MIEVGKYYVLNPDRFYFSIDLQRTVKLINPVIVKLTHTSTLGVLFGSLVDVGILIDIDTNNEIEFKEDDIIGEYELKNTPSMVNCYMDFNGLFT